MTEATVHDPRYADFINNDLGEYAIPVNADAPLNVHIEFTDQPALYLNRLGVKGAGEIGLVGTAAAITNAIFNATGKRFKTLPITLDKLMEPM